MVEVQLELQLLLLPQLFLLSLWQPQSQPQPVEDSLTCAGNCKSTVSSLGTVAEKCKSYSEIWKYI